MIGKYMKKDMNQQLEYYSKINFHNDLKNLEKDVNRRINLMQSDHPALKNRLERWFGFPVSVSASTIAATLVVGIFMGTQLPVDNFKGNRETLGFEVFRVNNAQLPSSLLAPKT